MLEMNVVAWNENNEITVSVQALYKHLELTNLLYDCIVI